MNLKQWITMMLIALAVMAAVALVIVMPTTARAAERTDPTKACGLEAGDYEELLAGTEMEGLGKALESGEKLYHVNGLFVAAICAHESGWGESRLARECNNLGGIKGGSGYRSFYNKEICVLYMFSLLERKYISQGRDNIGEIGKMYCETGGWAGAITSIMNGFIEDMRD